MLTEKSDAMSFRTLWPLTYVLISDMGQLQKKNKQKKNNNSKKSISYSNSFVQMHFIVIYFNYRIS